MDRLIRAALFLILIAGNQVLAETCTPTPQTSAGNNFEPVMRHEIHVGMGLLIEGRILDTDCRPIPGARIAHWQAGGDGVYEEGLRAYLHSDENGAYRFNTEWPVIDPPHIHFIITAKGFKPLTTQWVGEKRLDTVSFDMVLQRH